MKLIAFFLSLISYLVILLFFYFVFLKKPIKKENVYIHTAIILKYPPKLKNNQIVNKPQKKITQKKQKNVKKLKVGSKSAFTKGGNINFNDIFKNVNYNIPTQKVNLARQSGLSRFKGKILKSLKKLKNINVDISFKTVSNVSKGKVNELINKIYEIWNNISYIPGEYAIIKFIDTNGNIEVYILDSNLAMDKQKELIEMIKQIKYDKNIDITIKFQTKVHK